jgi:hypothetical protein
VAGSPAGFSELDCRKPGDLELVQFGLMPGFTGPGLGKWFLHWTIESRAKQGAAWFAEKLGRLKLNDSLLAYSDLSRVIELEAMSAVARERIALWDNLDSVGANDSRLEGITFAFSRDQSQQHLDELNAHRREAAIQAFLGEQTKA